MAWSITDYFQIDKKTSFSGDTNKADVNRWTAKMRDEYDKFLHQTILLGEFLDILKRK